jgi:cohesin domain-containing protein
VSRFLHQLPLLFALLVVACSGDGTDIVTLPEDEDPGGPAIVRLLPSRAVYHVGERVPIEVVIDEARDVASIAFRLRYDPQVLAFVPPGVEGPFLGSDGAETVFLAGDIPGRGEVAVSLSRLYPRTGIGGSGTLARFEFDAVSIGSCGFAFASMSVKDQEARNLPSVFRSIEVRVE